MEDAEGKEIEIGNIVAVQFKVVEFDGPSLVLEPLVSGQTGFPGKVAIEPKDTLIVSVE